jgi:hypothetical protein
MSVGFVAHCVDVAHLSDIYNLAYPGESLGELIWRPLEDSSEVRLETEAWPTLVRSVTACLGTSPMDGHDVDRNLSAKASAIWPETDRFDRTAEPVALALLRACRGDFSTAEVCHSACPYTCAVCSLTPGIYCVMPCYCGKGADRDTC